MNQSIFEPHPLNAMPLPFIFHLDTVNTNGGCFPNWHSNIELLFFIEGKGKVACGAESFAVQKGDLFVINSNVLHEITSNTRLRYYCLIPDNEFCKQNSLDTSQICFENLIQDDAADDLYMQVIQEFRTNGVYRNASIKCTVLSLLVYLAKKHRNPNPPARRTMERDENLRLVLGYMQANMKEPLTIDALATEAGLSKYYFLREFKRMTGDTPVTFINKIRCENAKKLLLSGCSVQEACAESGFENASYFGKVFKKITGISPREYQKEAHLS